MLPAGFWVMNMDYHYAAHHLVLVSLLHCLEGYSVKETRNI